MSAKAKYRVVQAPVDYFPAGVDHDPTGEQKGMVHANIGDVVSDFTESDAAGLMAARVIEDEPQPKLKGEES